MEAESPGIVSQALSMSAAVEQFVIRARTFYYEVMLSAHECPKCKGGLEMITPGRCRCLACEQVFDPTVAFQQCEACGGRPELKIRRYQCSQCGHDMASRFLFDGLVFDAEYFRHKMAESRERKHELRERVRQMLAGSRSEAVQMPPMDLTAMPGLQEALDNLVRTETSDLELPLAPAFSLSRYQAHVQAYIRPFAISLEQIPPLSDNRRLDRIWRFIAITFLAHAGIIDAWQNGPDVMVMKREIDPERQGVPGSVEESDGVEGAVG